VKRLAWDDNKPPKAFPSFSFLFQQLQSFCLMVVSSDELFWQVTSEEILKLPPTLTSLRLGFRGAHSLWFSNYKPKKVKSEYQSNIIGSEHDFEHLIDMKNAFPQLQTLELVGDNNPLGARLLTHFSPTLTSATLNSVMWGQYTCDSDFPPNLRYLDLTGAISVNWDFLVLLTQLERLELPNYTHAAPNRLPPSLQHLLLGWGDLEWSQTALEALSQHRNLTSLTCGNSRIIAYLPDSLRTGSVTGSIELDVKQLPKLPKQLRSFTGYRLSQDLSDFDFWPKTLTSLEFHFPAGKEFQPEDQRWLSLPKGLTRLRALSTRHLPIYIHPDMLPPLINRITIRRYGLENEIVDYSRLQHLEYLYIQIFHPKSKPAMAVAIDALNLEGKDNPSDLSRLSLTPSPSPNSFQFILPSSLTELIWSCHHYENTAREMPDTWYFRDSFADWLPASLITFTCDDVRLLTDKIFGKLPRELRSLTMRLKQKDCPVPFSSDALKSLPPRLTELQTVLNENADDSFMPFLPRSLTDLEINRITTLSDKAFEHLPRGLVYLNMRHLSHGITDSCITFLPRGLEHLKLEHNKTFTPETFFAHGFPNLSILDLRANPNFTKKRVLPCAPFYTAVKGKKWYRN
jgi:hypothetical protein